MKRRDDGKRKVSIAVLPDTYNTIRMPLRPIACWRLGDGVFRFDHKLIGREAKDEFDAFWAIRERLPRAPVALFGHADPTGDDAYNHTLAAERATAVYAVLNGDPDMWYELFAGDADALARSNAWSDGRLFNSIKVAVGLVGIRQSFISAADEKTLPEEAFVEFTGGVLSAIGGASGLRAALRDISGAGKFAFHRAPSFLDELPAAAKLARITELVSVVSKYQAVGKTDPSTLARDHANADLAVAWLSLMIVIYETTLATSFPVAGLALILLRWALFDQKLWDAIGGVTSASSMVKVVNGILDNVESGEIGALLKKAPNWGKVRAFAENLRAGAPPSVNKGDEWRFPLYFRLRTGHEAVLRAFSSSSYGLSEDIAEIIVDG